MGRRALYGGERGIKNRQDDLKKKMSAAAEADLAHDFGEGFPERDKFMETDLVRFQEIAQSYGISKFTASVTAFKSILGSNPFLLLRSTLPPQIFPAYFPGTVYKEDQILGELGINYIDIKNQFKKKMRAGETGENTAIRIDNLTIPIPGGGGTSRTYEVSGVLVKDKIGERKLNIASRFEQVTGGMVKKIALVIDASGGLSMTSLLNSDLTPLPNNTMDFYIIENIENDSDSATKLKTFDRPKNPPNKQPNLFFLKDETTSVLYPKFNLVQGENDAEMLFGNADVVLSRAGDEMEADFTFGPEETYHIEDVSQNANVKNASLNIIAATLAKGGTVSSDGIVARVGDRTPYLFPYIKRIGDWCQALSLLDGTRKYNILDRQHEPLTPATQTTLDDLRKDNTAIGLLTLDRILLGYALLLGIDVFFTTATDLRLLIYFKNTETQMTADEVERKVGKLKGDFETELATIGKDNVATILDEAVASVAGANTNTDYMQKLRGALYRVSVLRTDFDMITKKINEIQAKVSQPISDLEKYAAYFEGLTLLRKLKTDETHNETQRNSLLTYPSFVEEKQLFAVINNRPQSRDVSSKLKVVLSKTILNDAKQSKIIFEKYKKPDRLKEMVAYVPTEPNATTFQEIFKALGEVRLLFGASQQGGGDEDVESLKQFIVSALESKGFFAETVKPTDRPLPLMKGSYYRNDGSAPYTVIDDYMITKEDLPVFERILDGWSKRDRITEEKFVACRLMLLYTDMLRGELEKLKTSEDDVIVLPPSDDEDMDIPEDTGTKQPSDVKIANHKRIYYKAANLLDIHNKFLAQSSWQSAAIESLNAYKGADLLDNDTINSLTGRDALRSDDYDTTFAKIKTLQYAIAYTYENTDKRTIDKKAQRTGGRKTRRKTAA